MYMCTRIRRVRSIYIHTCCYNRLPAATFIAARHAQRAPAILIVILIAVTMFILVKYYTNSSNNSNILYQRQ